MEAGVRISLDGRGRALDTVFIQRLWRSVKYGDIYLRAYDDGHELAAGFSRYFQFYNHERPHAGIGKRAPADVYHNG